MSNSTSEPSVQFVRFGKTSWLTEKRTYFERSLRRCRDVIGILHLRIRYICLYGRRCRINFACILNNRLKITLNNHTAVKNGILCVKCSGNSQSKYQYLSSHNQSSSSCGCTWVTGANCLSFSSTRCNISSLLV